MWQSAKKQPIARAVPALLIDARHLRGNWGDWCALNCPYAGDTRTLLPVRHG